MSSIEFTRPEAEALAKKLQEYLNQHFELEIGQFDAEFFLDFISDNIGPHYYNKALDDARILIGERIETIYDGLYAIEKTVD